MDKEFLPTPAQVRAYLDLSSETDPVGALVESSLLEPLKTFFAAPGKGIRGQIVPLGFKLSPESGPAFLNLEAELLCKKATGVMEALHGGSLVVDDIQDDSTERRGSPTLHRTHGVPVALNAGNWLYFWPLHWISQWQLDKDREIALYRLCHDALLQAHFGQALDVGIAVDRLPPSQIWEVCLKSLELKTGALMGLGLALGSTLGRASAERAALLKEFGVEFGVALQMFDDIGNLRPHIKGAPNPKRFEDLKLRRPSFVWGYLAQEWGEPEFLEFRRAVQALPNVEVLCTWLENHGFIEKAKQVAARHLNDILQRFASELKGHGDFSEALTPLWQLAEKLKGSYE